MDLNDIITVARTAAHLEGISDPYGARVADYKQGDGKVNLSALREADAAAEHENQDAWAAVVKAVLQAAAK